MSKLEKTIADLQKNIDAANSEWEARRTEITKEFDNQVNREYGFFVGKVETMKKTLEMLTAPDDEDVEKKEVELETKDEGQKSIDQE